MDEQTPHQLVATSIETLHRAADLVNREEDQVLASGIQKAAGILEVLVAGLNEAPEEHVDEIPEAFTYVPEVLPLETLLTPISGENPGGENMRLSGKVNELLKLVVNRSHAADFRPQYSTLREKAEELLSTYGKDLGVAIRLVEAAITDDNISGFAAVADGLHLINGFFTEFWDDFIPEYEDGDFTSRCNELEQFEELVTMRLAGRYGEPYEFEPEYPDITAAGRESAVFDTIFEQLAILKKAAVEKMDDQAPMLKTLWEKLGIFRKRVNERYEAFRQQIQKKRDDAARQREQKINAAIDKVSDEVDSQYAPEKEAAASEIAEPKDMNDARQFLDSCARFLITQVPDDPLGYMIHRGQRWFSRSFDGPQAAPTDEQQQNITGLFSSKQWSDLLRSCEDLFTGGCHHWLDLQRYQVLAAEHLGPEYETVARYLTSAVVLHAAADNKVLDEKIDTRIPTASPETKQWIADAIAASEKRSLTAGDREQSESIFVKEIEKADDLVRQGKSGDALKHLQKCHDSARSRREQFLWQLHIAEFCIRSDMTKIALPRIEHMVKTIDHLNLTDWEDPETLIRLFKLGYNGYFSLGYDKAPEDKLNYFYQRICLYDPAHFISGSGD
jgi:type VI secretion system ImpA/VasJ family protein